MLHPKKIWHKIDHKPSTDTSPEVKAKDWHLKTMEAIDANHAVEVDPEHWSFEKPVEEKIEEVITGAGDPGQKTGDEA